LFRWFDSERPGQKRPVRRLARRIATMGPPSIMASYTTNAVTLKVARRSIRAASCAVFGYDRTSSVEPFTNTESNEFIKSPYKAGRE
jgi:hypothetical protein